VVEASWRGARAYCRRRGARLPSEAEWERTARGTEARIHPWGSAPPSAPRARFAAGWNQTATAGSLTAGATVDGILDLAGNVHEWTSSLYRPYPYVAGDGREDGEAPGERITRGGAHDSGASELRSAWRGAGVSRAPRAGHHNIGFRCAKSLR
jgi:iron(II)-dependent oxidoreductase